MHNLRILRDWRAISWWLMVLGVTLVIKHRYSISSVADLDWMLRPLSMLLEWISGHAFYRDRLDEWVSISADVRLVKGCAGINFLLMSLLAWAWVFRPASGEYADTPSWIAVQILLLCALFAAAWGSSLLANSLRVLIAMNLPDHGTGVHRIIGMTIYVPLLSLQLLLGDRKNWKDAIVGPVLLYFLLMALVPLLTGNASRNPALFFDHLFYLSAMAVLMVGLYYTKYRFSPVGGKFLYSQEISYLAIISRRTQ